jgi:hypothetical protein
VAQAAELPSFREDEKRIHARGRFKCPQLWRKEEDMPQQKAAPPFRGAPLIVLNVEGDRDATPRYFTIVMRVVAITPSPRIRTK